MQFLADVGSLLVKPPRAHPNLIIHKLRNQIRLNRVKTLQLIGHVGCLAVEWKGHIVSRAPFLKVSNHLEHFYLFVCQPFCYVEIGLLHELLSKVLLEKLGRIPSNLLFLWNNFS